MADGYDWREGFDSFNRGDYEAWIALFKESCVWRPATIGGIQGSEAEYRGHDGLRSYLEHAFADFEELTMQPDHAEEVDNVLFLTGHAIGRGRQSGAEVAQPVAWVFEIDPVDELVRRGFSSFDIDGARDIAREWRGR